MKFSGGGLCFVLAGPQWQCGWINGKSIVTLKPLAAYSNDTDELRSAA
jgi:hypothetical protein